MNKGQSFLKLSFPPKCIFCGKLIDSAVPEICSDCLRKLPLKSGNICQKCSVPVPYTYGNMLCNNCRSRARWFDRAVAPFIYKDEVRAAITKFKFRAKKCYAKTFAFFMAEEIKKSYDVEKIDCVSYVPLHIFRRIKRGYNQSKLLAWYISDFLNIPLEATLTKTKNTPRLSSMKRATRQAVVRGAYKLKSKDCNVSGRRVLLVDDIITTGATLSECSRILKRGGAISVFAVSAAQTTPE